MTCRFCQRDVPVPCMNTRDMEAVADELGGPCEIALIANGGGERTLSTADPFVDLLAKMLVKERGQMLRLFDAASALMRQADGSMIGAGYQRGGDNVVMVLEASVNHVCDLRDALLTMRGKAQGTAAEPENPVPEGKAPR